MMQKIIDGNKIAQQFKNEIKKEIENLKKESKLIPKLVAVQVGENPASKVYVKNQSLNCNEVGIEYELVQFQQDITEEQLIFQLDKLNSDKTITGIILQMPLPSHINSRYIQSCISFKKDVEGITPASLGALFYSDIKLVTAPCTAMAVMEILKTTGIELKGKETVIIGHSEIVGKPLVLMLLNSILESATPTVCHIATKNLKVHTSRAEILIVAVGKPGLITGDMIKEGSIVIDVGINRVPVKDEKGNTVLDEKGKPKMKTVGDVVYEQAIEKVSLITPVPGGVGPVTTAMLLRNTMQLYRTYQK